MPTTSLSRFAGALLGIVALSASLTHAQTARGGQTNPCVGTTVLIHVVQGAGAASECVGATVAIEGVVVGDYEGPAPALSGFYVQEEDSDQDTDALTSEGIFVFNGNNDNVALGDLVRVTGTVAEVQGQTQINEPDSILVQSNGNQVSATEVTLPLASTDALEAVEGMLVSLSQTLYVTEHFQLGRFGQVVVSSGDRLYQPTDVAEPGAPSAEVAEANALNRLFVDDAENGQNPDPIRFARGGSELTASNTLRSGDSISNTVGVMTYTWAGNAASGEAFRLRPLNALGGQVLFQAANPRPAAVPAMDAPLRMAGFNVLNYFLTLDDQIVLCGPFQNIRCRGADTAEELTRQRDKLLAALLDIDAAVVGLAELENSPDVSPEADLVGGLNELTAPGQYDWIDASSSTDGLVGPDVLRVGLLYQPTLVTPVGEPVVYSFSLDPQSVARSRAVVAQTFADNITGVRFTVAINHFKSKSGSEIDDPGGECETNPTYQDCQQGDGQGYFNATRTLHAQELATWLAADPTNSGSAHSLILGDLNSYSMEDPIFVLQDAGFVNLASGAGSYSFVFSSQFGSLDYAMASLPLASSVTGAAAFHINSDEPLVLDYNVEFKTQNHVSSLYAADAFRTSDHDPIVVGLDLDLILGTDFENSKQGN